MISFKKQNYFFLITFTSIIILIYFLTGVYCFLDFKKKEKYLFKNINNLNFHIKYSNKLNHIRATNYNGDIKEFLYTKINAEGNDELLLFQGDSWFEQIMQPAYSASFNELKKFSLNKNVDLINAGISSFSPSLMHVQYQILKEDFNINPTILVIHIDQTDIGDEFCRYKSRRVFDDNNNLIAIKRYNYEKSVFDLTKIYEYSKINLTGNGFTKFTKLTNFQIKYFLKRNFNRYKEIKIHGWQNRNYTKCRFREIKNYLINNEMVPNNYFKESLRTFLDYLNTDKNLKKVLITSFPHRGHIENSYKNNVSDLINDVIIDYNEKFKHLSFSNIEISKLNLDKIFVINDEASHINPQPHKDIFLKKIIEELSNEINPL